MADHENHETPLFSLLPEGCIANIISLTSPEDACRAAAVSSGFKSAAESNTVWERFLPPDYEEIVSRSDSPVAHSSKKELYFMLCGTGLLLDGGKLSFGLSRLTGKKCYLLSARKLEITWIDTPSYWEWTSLPASRFAEVAELQSVCWLEICGKIKAEMLSPNTKYAAYLVFKLSEENYGLDCSSKASVKYVNQDTSEIEGETTRSVYIVPTRSRRVTGRRVRTRVPIANVDRRNRTDGWLEIELGVFFIAQGDKFVVEIRLLETEILNWKRGLIVEGIELRPKGQR